jgi:hypothetical protein
MTVFSVIPYALGVMLMVFGAYLVWIEIRKSSSSEILREISFFGIKIKCGRAVLIIILGGLLFMSPSLLAYAKYEGFNPGIVPSPKDFQVLSVASLESPDYTNFEILKDTRVIDLRSRKKVPDNKAKEMFSPVTWVRYTLLKKKKQATTISFHFATTGTGLSPRSLTHRYILKKLNEPTLLGGGELKTQWEVEVDISEHGIEEEFMVITEATFWNAFTGEEKEWASIMSDYTINELGMILLFPEDKPYKSHVFKTQQKGEERIEDFHGTLNIFPSPSKQSLSWKIIKPKTNVNYRVHWEW